MSPSVTSGTTNSYGLEAFLLQPFTNRKVVEFRGCICHEKSEEKYADRNKDMSRDGSILVAIYPCHLYIDEWEVGNV